MRPLRLLRSATAVMAVASLTLAYFTVARAAVPPMPDAKRIPVSDVYFGKTIVDPYRWMEAVPRDPDFTAFLKANNDRTRAVLDALPGRAALETRIAQLAETAVQSSGVQAHHGTYFYEKTPAGANAAKLYVRAAGGRERVLLDPDTLGSPRRAISFFVPSNDGSHVAVGLAAGGSENTSVAVVAVASGKRGVDDVTRADFGVTSWSDDGRAFFYMKRQVVLAGAPPTAKYENIRAFEHVLGQPESADVAVFGAGIDASVDVAPKSFALVAVYPDSPFAEAVVIDGVSRFVTAYIAPKAALGDPANVRWKRIVAPEDKVTNATLHGTTAYALTAKDAPRFKVVRFDAGDGFASATDVLPAGTRVYDGVNAASDALYVNARENGLARVVRVAYAGDAATDVPLPVNGTIAGVTTEFDRPGFVAQLSSWTASPLWYAYDSSRGTLVDTKIDAPSTADYANVVSDEVEVVAADGTKIPLSIVHRRDLKRDGKNPTLLYAYGSYGISSDASFSATRLAFLERGGVFAVAHVRGGGEYGEEWHLAGKDAKKPNTIKDFITCARWLEAQGFTSPAKLGARGGSAGGITMGGAIDDAPELFAAVLDEIPVSDQLRIETTPNGPPNVPEFGSTSTRAGFDNLYATSPYHHIARGVRYPAVMLTTGINDPRVDSWQAAKMAAALSVATSSGKPILLRVDYDGGHGLIGAGRSQAVTLTTDEYSFLFWQFGDPAFQPAS